MSLSPAGAQSLGDVARSERERRGRMAQHAPMLTDEDLRRDRILKKAPGVSDSALPSPENTTPTAVDENLPLGDYARALRRRRLAEPAPPENAVATGPAPETLPAPVAIVAHQPQPAVAPAAAEPKPASLGDLAREVRAERAAARRIRLQEQKRAAQEKLAQQKPAPQAAQQKPVQPAVQASKNLDAVRTAKVTQPSKPAPQAAHVAATATKSANPAQLTEVAAKPSAPQVVKAAPQTVVKVAPLAAQATPVVTRIKPAQLTTVATKPVPQPAPQAKAEERASTADGQTVRVPRGASLWTLARTYLGAGSLWAALWKANPQIKDPNRIRAGQTLRLPDLDNQDTPSRDGL
jgi:nucleoid-associated protein YgaU